VKWCHTVAYIAEFSLPIRALPGGAALTDDRDVRIEAERVVPSDECLMPLFWVWDDDVDAFLRTVERDDLLSDVTVLHRVADGALLRVTWSPDADVVKVLASLDVTVLDAVGTGVSWFVRLRARDYQSFTAFSATFEAQGIEVELEKLYEVPADPTDHNYRLTADQRETLVTAYEEGYFDDPRKVTQQELGALFGVSGRAMSTRLRRGMKTLVANTLLTPTGTPRPTRR
jgi:hypothetical protein